MSAFDWLDARTGYRTALHHLLEEELPAGIGWWFVTGSIVLFLLGLQLVTGVALAMYYVPAPEFAHDSVRYIMDALTLGGVLRGLHVFGASFIVVAATVHMLRVVALGSYKAPREVTWLTGVLLLLVIMAFALTGYLLPWDQKAYWATTVTINIARSTPVVGEFVARLLKGGSDLGALTLLRWYAAHVFLLPAALVGFTVAHLFLMRRHQISGPLKPSAGRPEPFYPHHAVRDTVAIAVVFSALLTLAVVRPPSLGPVADPSDATFVPRPEWYFLSLFQLLKYFPGALEPVATMVIPGLVVAGLLLLPFLDRSSERHLFKRPLVTGGFAVLGVGMLSLTYLGLKDSPAEASGPQHRLLALAGQQLTQDAGCQRCHSPGAVANPVDALRLRRDSEWLAGHLADPEVIAPGLRPAPKGGLDESQIRPIVAYLEATGSGDPVADPDPNARVASMAFAKTCSYCHQIDGDGEAVGPDLTHIGSKHDAKWLREWIDDPSKLDQAATMPAFNERLAAREIDAVAAYLAQRK